MKTFWIIAISLMSTCLMSQAPLAVENPKLQSALDRYLSLDVKTISVDSLCKIKDDVLLLDAREKEEYMVSHIPGARWIGYSDWNESLLDAYEKDQKIVLYCSIGYRSEKLTHQLQELGYTQAMNLYGSIFEWVEKGLDLENDQGPVRTVHTYNKKWSRYLSNEDYQKTW